MTEKGVTGYEIPSTDDWFLREFTEYVELLKGGEQNISYEDFISPVFIMNAIERSLKNGGEEEIRKYTV